MYVCTYVRTHVRTCYIYIYITSTASWIRNAVRAAAMAAGGRLGARIMAGGIMAPSARGSWLGAREGRGGLDWKLVIKIYLGGPWLFGWAEERAVTGAEISRGHLLGDPRRCTGIHPRTRLASARVRLGSHERSCCTIVILSLLYE